MHKGSLKKCKKKKILSHTKDEVCNVPHCKAFVHMNAILDVITESSLRRLHSIYNQVV